MCISDHIYAIRSAEGPIKIGISLDPIARRAEFQKRLGLGMELVYAARTSNRARLVEKRVCVLLADKQLSTGLSARKARSEWFAVSDEEAIEAIEQAAIDCRVTLAPVTRTIGRGEVLLTKEQVLERMQRVSRILLARRMIDCAMPPPIRVVSWKSYWAQADVIAWERRILRAEKPKATEHREAA